MPMFVGLVRGATTRSGFCWMLSGGSQLSSAVTNSSKYRHVLRDSFSRNCCWFSESRSAGLGSGRLSHQAISGEAIQAASNGPRTGQYRGIVKRE